MVFIRAIICACLLGCLSPASATELGSKTHDCVIEPAITVKLASPAAGLLASIFVERGDRVQKGQIVARLEDSVEEANLAIATKRATSSHAIDAARAKFTLAKAKFSRIERLRISAVASEASYDEALSEMRIAEQQVGEAEQNLRLAELEAARAAATLKQRTIRSPIDGVVVDRLLSPGEYRNEQAHIMVLAQVDPLRVEVLVPTALYGQVQIGNIGIVRPELPIGGRYTATVTVVDHVIDSASGTFGVRLSLPNKDAVLPGGLRCVVQFQPERSASAGGGE